MTEIIKRAQEKLKDHPNRLKHVEGVAETAVKLAHIHGVDPEKARIAGYWHDTSKYDDIQSQIKDLDPQTIERYKTHPVIFHALAAAKSLEREFGIHDEEILSAIRCHVWGNKVMSTLDKIIFVADSCEPNRGFEDSLMVFQLATEDLDQAVIYCMKQSIEHVIDKGKTPSIDQLTAYEYHMEEKRGKTQHTH
jgi:predicted HD superfamily hydrolase involved in NAD metabolism